MILSTVGTIAYMNKPFTISTIFTPADATNKSVTWCSSDPSIAEMGSNGKLITHKPGNVTITAITADGSFSASADIRVVYDKITIMKDGNYNKVVFEHGNKEWLCLSKDIIYTETDIYYDEDVVRAHKNFHKNYVWNNFFASDLTVKEYTDEELKMLYVIDPHGVAFYIQKYADLEKDSLEDGIQYKDEKFEMLFGRQPKHFIRNAAGIWEETTDLRDITKVLSESEFIFGTHPIWDAFSLGELVKCVAQFLETLINLATSGPVNFALNSAVDFLEYCALLGCGVEAEFWDFVQDVGENALSLIDVGKGVLSFNASITMVESCTDMTTALNEFKEAIAVKPMYQKRALCNYIYQTEYYIFAQLNNGQAFAIQDAIESLDLD